MGYLNLNQLFLFPHLKTTYFIGMSAPFLTQSTRRAYSLLGRSGNLAGVRGYAVIPSSTARTFVKKTVSSTYKPVSTPLKPTVASVKTVSTSAKPAASTASTATSSAVTNSKSTIPANQSTTSIGVSTSPEKMEFRDAPLEGSRSQNTVDWSQSYHGLGTMRFSEETGKVLTAPLDENDIEIKPDGLIYLPEIKYRRILNKAFGPGGWGLAPRSETIITPKMITREYALVAEGRLVAIARGEQDYFDPNGIPTATEGCKSNAMMRCCKDLGVASELWDPRFIRTFKKKNAQQIFVEHVTTKKKKAIWMRKDDEVSYPFKKC